MRRKSGSVLTVLLVLWGLFGALYGASSLSGRVTDQTGGVLPGAEVEAVNVDTSADYTVITGETGLYVIPNVAPGTYAVTCQMAGFAKAINDAVEVHVEDVVTVDFILQVGLPTETVTVQAGAQMIQTDTATVDTLITREFVEDLPLNGRSFHTLIHLTPGAVAVGGRGTNFGTKGDFSVNGQRANANYYTVDGVSANTGAGFAPGNLEFGAGSVPATTAFGGTNNLASVDAMEEFRIQTSTYAPEYGRQPGAQVQIRTRAGTNDWHGNLFWYFRNDALDAND